MERNASCSLQIVSLRLFSTDNLMVSLEMTVPKMSETSVFTLSRFRPQDAEEVAAFLNELRQQHWTLTSSAYQRKPERLPRLTGEALLEEQREHPHRIGYYILRYRDRIIASMKIDDKFGDRQAAVCADLETHPDFQRRGLPWFRLLPCVRQVIEMDFQWVELVTWVFNRKGLPLYKRCGFRAVPGTSLLMENYLPLLIRHPALRPYFQRHDYIKTLINKRSYGYDHLMYHDLYVFPYQWRAGDKTWEVLVDFQRRQIASIGCREWSFGAWVVNDEPLQVRVRLENRAKGEMVCSRSDDSGVVFGALRGEERQVEWDAGEEGCVDLVVQVGRLQFPFTVRHQEEITVRHHEEKLAQRIDRIEGVHA